MMARDDILVGLGEVFAINESDPSFSSVGVCNNVKAIPQGGGGLLWIQTLYGLARDLPRSPRRYTAENSVKYGAPRDTDHPELRQPLALEVWESVVKTLDPGSKITILTNGPLTTLASIISSSSNTTSLIQDVYIVGGHISSSKEDKGNVFLIPSSEYAEYNMFLDPLAARTVFDSSLNLRLIPLGIQQRVSSFPNILKMLRSTKKTTPEALFVQRLQSRLYRLQQLHPSYHHMGTFLGELLGAVLLDGDSHLSQSFKQHIKVFANNIESSDGEILISQNQGKLVTVLDNVNPKAYYEFVAERLRDSKQSAVLASFEEQKKLWQEPPNHTEATG